MTRIFALIIAAAVIMALSSCSSYKSPKSYNIENERIFSKDYESVWQRVISVFTEFNIPIRNMDKSSGLITTDYNLGAEIGQYVDCGTPAKGLYTYRFENTVMNMNIVVTKVSPAKTKVRVKVFPKSEYAAYEYNNGRWYKAASEIINCVSTGRMEKNILDYVGK